MMEVQNMKKSDGGEANFILPETEKALNIIVEEIAFFFSVCRLVLQLVYIAYLLVRAFFLNQFFKITILLLAVCVFELIIMIVNMFGVCRNFAGSSSLKILRRVISFVVALVVCMDIFVLSETIQRWQGISAVLICLGWILAFAGDLFNATVPRYIRMILKSFKKDIEPSALASRSFEKVKEAAGHIAKKKAVKSLRGLRNWLSDIIQP